MRKHQPPFLRLVVDKRSSSDTSTPRSRASRKISSSLDLGMPRSGQLRTADSDKPKEAAKALAPPNLSIISGTCIPDHISHIGTYCNPEMRFMRTRSNPNPRVTRTKCPVTIWDMGETAKKYGEFGGRLKAARQALIDGDAKDFAAMIDIKEQTYRNYERGDRLPDDEVIARIAREGISLDWLFLAERPMLDPARMAKKQQTLKTARKPA